MSASRLLSVVVLSVSAIGAVAQAPPPPAASTILVINREYLKPGKSGEIHAKSESAFVKAMAAAKYPTYYVGMDSMSGPSRALFMTLYDSMDAWEKDNTAMAKNTTLSAAIDKATMADGDLLSGYDVGVFHLRASLSMNPGFDPAANRYFEILQFAVRPGHEEEFEQMISLYQEAFKKVAPDESWATFQTLYGTLTGSTYLTLFPRKSLAQVDQEFAESGKAFEALGEGGQKTLLRLQASSVESVTNQLFHFNPRESYVSDRYKTVDPEFWTVKQAPVGKAPAKP